MAVFETWLKSDLKKPLDVKRLDGFLYLGDDEANLIGVEVFDGGEVANLSGDVYGYIIRGDDDTVVVQGTLDGNKASVVLPDVVYAVAGAVSIVIKVGTTTVCACAGKVYRAQTDTIADPEDIIPSVQELLERIQAALDAADTATEAAESASGDAESAASSAEAAEDFADECREAAAIVQKLITPKTAFAIPAKGNSVSFDMSTMTAKHQLIRWNFSVSPENYPPVFLTWATYDGYFTITNTDGTTSESIQPVFGIPTEIETTTHTTT